MRWIEAEDGSLVNLEGCSGICVRAGGAGNDVGALIAFDGPLHFILATGSTERCEALLRNLASEMPGAVWRVGTPPKASSPPVWDEDGGRRGD